MTDKCDLSNAPSQNQGPVTGGTRRGQPRSRDAWDWAPRGHHEQGGRDALESTAVVMCVGECLGRWIAIGVVIDIAAAKGLAGRGEDRHLVDPSSQSAGHALFVGHQR